MKRVQAKESYPRLTGHGDWLSGILKREVLEERMSQKLMARVTHDGVFVDTALHEKNCTVKAENTRLLQNGNYHFTFNLPLVVWFGCISLA